MCRTPPLVLVVLAALLTVDVAQAAPAKPTPVTPPAAEPTVDELVKRYDALMGPVNFESTSLMVAHRDDGTERTYRMRVLKKGDDKLRLSFQEPAAVKGQELLRQGDNSWVYMPNMKRSMRLANRDSFQGGDFNNADVMRVNYGADYTAAFADAAGVPETYCIDLTAKTTDAAYDRIKLWVRKADTLPVKAEFYSASGKMLRMAEYSEYKDFGGITRPALITMKNMLATKRYSLLRWEALNTKVDPPASKFVIDDLGK